MEQIIADAVAANAEDTGGRSAPRLCRGVRPVARDDGQKVVTRMSTSGGRHWGIDLGAFATRSEAEKLLMATALQDLSALDGALRKIAVHGGKYMARFVGLSETMANRACARITAQRRNCAPLSLMVNRSERSRDQSIGWSS